MVTKFIKILCLLTLFAPAFAPAAFAPRFKMEFSKKEIFVGEQVMCNFIVYTDAGLIDVEVAKFPEFRGYWVENLVLRQGPMSTQIGMNQPENSVVVGTYLLIPIVDRAQRSIDPMRVVIRNPATGEITGVAPDYIASAPDPLVIKPLPPLPPGTDAQLFKGAVGRFEFNATDPFVDFQKDEPFVLRFMLQGEGNFQEINDIALPLPPKIEVLSKRSSTQGMGRFNNKLFEITLAAHTDQSLTIPGVPFVYFDPIFKRYSLATSHPIQLRRQANAEVADIATAPIAFSPYEGEWHPYRPLWGARYFVLSQILLAILFASLFLGRIGVMAYRRHQNSPRKLRQMEWEAAKAKLAAGDPADFLRQADRLLFEVLCARAKLEPAQITRHRLLESLRTTLSEPELSLARNLFELYQSTLFSREHPTPEDLPGLAQRLDTLISR